ncbi:low molecular weight protein-tyrosine-phosphatase [Mariniluteicoccus endophyticus]
MPEVVFVCWGNICRSPMAERVAEKYAADAGVDARFTSAGVSSEEIGSPIDPRARQWLTDHGYRADDHRAHRITADEIDAADLVVAMEQTHVDRMLALRPRRSDHIRLLTDFDPDAEPGSGVPDPWYGDADGFGDTLRSVEAAMPALVEQITSRDMKR